VSATAATAGRLRSRDPDGWRGSRTAAPQDATSTRAVGGTGFETVRSLRRPPQIATGSRLRPCRRHHLNSDVQRPDCPHDLPVARGL